MDMENLLARASDNLSVRRAFGAAYEKDGLLIIPVTMVAGGGFGGLVLPAGAYVVRGDQVRWVPAVSPAIVALASLSLVRMLTGAWARRRRNHGLP